MSTELMDIDSAIESSFAPAEEVIEYKGDDTASAESKKDEDAKDVGEKTEPEDGEGSAKKEGEDTTDPTDKKDTPEKKQNRADKRVEQLLRERYQLRRELDEVKSRVKPEAPEPPKKPDPNDFKYDPKDPESVKDAQRKYDFAMGKYHSYVEAHNERVANNEKESENKERARIKNEQAEYAARIEEGKKEYPDYDECFSNIADSFEMTEALHTALLESKDPAGILRFLGKNPMIAENVLSMSTTKQAIKLAEIDVKLQYAKANKIKRVSNAPSPPAKVASGGGGKKDPAKMSAQEYYDTFVKNKKK